MVKYLIIITLCMVLSRGLKLRVLSLGLLFCIGVSYIITEYTDSIELIVMCTHFSVIFVSLLLLAAYEKSYIVMVTYGSSLILTLISYTVWQYPLLVPEPLNMLILQYGATLGLEVGLMILLARESFKSFRGCMLLTMVLFTYFVGYL